jgi:hypothetical protein
MLGGCVEEFHGSELQIDFSQGTPSQASNFLPQSSTELPSNIHFTLYASSVDMDANGMNVGNTYAIQTFEIHRLVDLASPCFIDVGDFVPFPGLHVSKYADKMMEKYMLTDLANPGNASMQAQIEVATAVQRENTVELMASDMGPVGVVSWSGGAYGEVAADCNDTTKIPAPSCMDDASNARRLQMCQTEWKNNNLLFEGTDRVLTLPLNGTTYGFVEGMNPLNLAPIGGAAFFVDESLADFKTYALYWQFDDVNGDGMPDYPPSFPATDRHELGQLFMYGNATAPTRGVQHVHMVNPLKPTTQYAEMAIFPNIDQDSVHF